MKEYEFGYYGCDVLDFPLSDEIKIIDKDSKDDTTCIISNSKELSSQIVAPEIDFYINNSEDDILTKINSVKTLYEARITAFDLAQYLDYEQEVGNLLLVVSEDEPTVFQKLKEEGFKAILLHPEQMAYVSGHLGELNAGIMINEEVKEVKTDQILWFDAPEFALLQSGVYDLKDKSDEEIVTNLKSKCGEYKYKNYISYDTSICQYHERGLTETCGKCAEVCPTVAITKDDENKHLVLSHIDCESCGGCISVCPSGALDYTQMPRNAFFEIARMYKGKRALIVPRKMEKFLDSTNVKLPVNTLPLAIEGEKYLHEAHFLSLLQESGSQIVFYTDFLSKGSKDAIYMLNQIYQAKYQKDAIFVAMNEEELSAALLKVGSIEDSDYGINEDGLRKREIFSARLSHLVGNEDLGSAKIGENVYYGLVKVDDSKCTLCLSCVGECNVGAFSAHEEDYSLRLDNSVCTACKYCEVVCPEDAIEVIRGEIPLKPSWFGSNVVAQDEMFSCVMCYKPFATKKSVEKIANMMIPLFAGNEVKIKTLYCCADCKPKVMFESHILKEEEAKRAYEKRGY